jgi:hypothetical protein
MQIVITRTILTGTFPNRLPSIIWTVGFKVHFRDDELAIVEKHDMRKRVICTFPSHTLNQPQDGLPEFDVTKPEEVTVEGLMTGGEVNFVHHKELADKLENDLRDGCLRLNSDITTELPTSGIFPG